MRIFSDPHLELVRKAHTTVNSRVALREFLSDQMMKAMTAGQPKKLLSEVVCAGDLFHTFSNDETAILRAAVVADTCSVILAGNHDLVNDTTLTGSLDLVDQLLENTEVIINDSLDTPMVSWLQVDGMQCLFIPHHASQELFDKAIDKALQSQGHFRAVFLHCNYENSMTLGSDTSLNLTKTQAEQLLEISDYVFMGHEHQSRKLLDDRLIIIGSPAPTGFGDISDKYCWDLTEDDLTRTTIWHKEQGYAELKFDSKKMPKIPQAQFIDITGQISLEEGVDLAEYIRECWEVSGAFMIRNRVEVVSDSTYITETLDLNKLPDEIEKTIKGGPLEEKWLHYRGLVKC